MLSTRVKTALSHGCIDWYACMNGDWYNNECKKVKMVCSGLHTSHKWLRGIPYEGFPDGDNRGLCLQNVVFMGSICKCTPQNRTERFILLSFFSFPTHYCISITTSFCPHAPTPASGTAQDWHPESDNNGLPLPNVCHQIGWHRRSSN